MINFLIGAAAIIATILIYIAAIKLYRRFPHPLMLPILTGTLTIIASLLVFDISYQTYSIGGQWIDRLLGPAVVALAYPMYKQWETLKTYYFPILAGVASGAIFGVGSGILLAKWANIDPLITYSLTPKSVTTPVAMDIADTIGGAPPLAAVFVMVAGIGGAVVGPFLFKWLRIESSLAKGIGMGTASHAIGTAKAMENSQEEGAVSSVAMTISAVVVSVITPLFIAVLM